MRQEPKLTDPRIIAAVFFFIAASLSAQEAVEDVEPAPIPSDWGAAVELGAMVDLGTSAADAPLLSDRLRASLEAWSPGFFLSGIVAADSDGRYPSHQSFELGHYFEVEEGFVELSLGAVKLSGGRFRQSDEIDSPYSLFLSSRGNPAAGMSLAWASPLFSYESRWIQLNADSDRSYEGTSQLVFDRGMNYKAYSLSLGRLRLGYQDSSVYLYESFDVESFLSPVPAYIQQMVLSASGRPYSEVANPNSLMGFFAEWDEAAWNATAQVLVDDINASFLSPLLGWAIPALRDVRNVQKIAWSLGGRLDTEVGRFGFFHAGATKYSFEATYTSATNPDAFSPAAPGPDYSLLPYEYCYYPFSAYSYYGGTGLVDYRDNYIGFYHGENALAFTADWAGEIFTGKVWQTGVRASLEYAINGAKSPNNPWHELDSFTGIGRAFVLLDDPVLEHELLLRVDAETKPFRGWSFDAGLSLGWIWNGLEAAAYPGLEDEALIWSPVSGNHKPLAALSLGASHRFGSPSLAPRRPVRGGTSR